jgi:hypothetical protein
MRAGAPPERRVQQHAQATHTPRRQQHPRRPLPHTPHARPVRRAQSNRPRRPVRQTHQQTTLPTHRPVPLHNKRQSH